MLGRISVGILCVFSMGASATDFYVAPNGNDEAAGTASAPFATVARAQQAVREAIKVGLDADVTVHIRAGAYELAEPLVFGVEDSGTEPFSVTYAAEGDGMPLLSGGHAISGWKSVANGKWVVELPEARAGAWRFRQLFKDGERLPRGRFPNGDGLLRVKSVSPDVTRIELDQVPSARNLGGDAELVMYQNWSISRESVIASDGAMITTATPMGWIGHGDATTASPGKPCYLENALEFVDAPGEWYLDRATGVLTYQAAEGEDPAAHAFVAPRLEQLVRVTGTPDAPVRNLHFRGLAFEQTEWPLPDVGYLGIQAGHYGTHMQGPTFVLPLAIEFVYAESCGLDGCRIRHTGACGAGFGAGCRNNALTRCALEDIGGNGIMIGWRGRGQNQVPNLVGDAALSADWTEAADVPTANSVENCTLRRCGAVNQGCVGIYDGFCAATRIVHNLVEDMPYTGISIGFRWDSSDTSQRDTLVAFNHVHDVMKVLADGGAIYTLGYQPGTILRGNHLHHVHRSAFAHGGAPNNGVFFDQGSKGYLVEGNLIHDTSGAPIRFNQTNEGNLTWQDNHFGVEPDAGEVPRAIAENAGPVNL
ncbi:MAG TPA: right-handed parallel beta-helix repeat-containing protein [Candidatus Hydrogenedentes bacterium]|nr:right-handed parallel beta-helix repeat-containing protein [Candidatus Hydrogenedentota bacterium]